jgi:hypothetical protein
MAFLIEVISQDYLDGIRSAGVDAAGNSVRAFVDEEGGSPLRCCLREIRPGERVQLIGYQPPGGAGAYRETGPVFVHAERCDGYPADGGYPPELSHRRVVVRGYDHAGGMAEALLAEEGDTAERLIEEMLARPDIEVVQVRNVLAGCYNFAARPVTV